MSDTTTPTSQTPVSGTTKSMDDIVALCRRRGFIWQSSEIYGGINGFWDYGPLGTQLKRNLKNAWWHDLVLCPPPGPDGKPISIVPVDCTIIMNSKVWEASGHVSGFNDPMVDDRDTKQRYRADQIGVLLPKVVESNNPDIPTGSVPFLFAFPIDDAPTNKVVSKLKKVGKEHNIQLEENFIDWERASKIDPTDFERIIAPESNKPGGWLELSKVPADRYDRIIGPDTTKPSTLTEPRQFNLMFETYVGAVRDEEAKSYLRPETAQGIFVNFTNVVDTIRVKVPFGIAQIGKAFRNEVTPRNFTFRSREFEMMEIEFFIHRSEAAEWYQYWRDSRYKWWQSVGLAGDNLQLRQHEQDELSHYAKEGAGTTDVEYRFPFTAPGFGELEGIAHRTDYDLRQHAQFSGYGDKLKYFDPDRKERYFPHVVEPSAGADRGSLALICEAYTPDESRPSKVFLKFHPRLAPIKAAVFPLVNKDGMPEVAEKLYLQLRSKFACQFDVKQTIGKRYARMDEAGTPYCFTIDGDTLRDQTVTVRYRDTQQQDRISLDKVAPFLAEKIGV